MGNKAAIISSYSDFASFDTATGALTVEDFGPTDHRPITSSILDENTAEAGIVPGLIEVGLTFSTQIGSGFFFNIDSGDGRSSDSYAHAGGFNYFGFSSDALDITSATIDGKSDPSLEFAFDDF